MTITIYNFGSKFVVRNPFGESCYPERKPKVGDVLRMTGTNGPAQRMVSHIQDFTTTEALVAKGRKIIAGLKLAKCRWCGKPGQTRLCSCGIHAKLTFTPFSLNPGPIGILP